MSEKPNIRKIAYDVNTFQYPYPENLIRDLLGAKGDKVNDSVVESILSRNDLQTSIDYIFNSFNSVSNSADIRPVVELRYRDKLSWCEISNTLRDRHICSVYDKCDDAEYGVGFFVYEVCSDEELMYVLTDGYLKWSTDTISNLRENCATLRTDVQNEHRRLVELSAKHQHELRLGNTLVPDHEFFDELFHEMKRRCSEECPELYTKIPPAESRTIRDLVPTMLYVLYTYIPLESIEVVNLKYKDHLCNRDIAETLNVNKEYVIKWLDKTFEFLLRPDIWEFINLGMAEYVASALKCLSKPSEEVEMPTWVEQNRRQTEENNESTTK